MSDLNTIEGNLVGPPETQQRRAALLAILWQAFTEGGPHAATEAMNRRMDELEGAFASQLEELKRQL